MTPQEIGEYARQQWNAVGDQFFSDDELYRHVYAAQMELALHSDCIREILTTSTVADQQEYSKPTNCVKIKRITYNGLKLFKVTDREDDALTLNNSNTTSTGTPEFYSEWGDSVFLRPIPAEVGTLKIFSFNQPQEVTSLSTMEVPTRYHLKVADYLLWKMATKEKNFEAAGEYAALWLKHLKEARDFERKALRGDSFATVGDENTLPLTVIGVV
jgi:hypothetical protein